MHPLSLLNQEFIARGWNRKPTGRLLAELALHVTLALGGIALVVLARSPWLDALGILVSTMGSLGVSTNTHTSSHYSTATRRWVNRALTYFGYPLFLGMSATYWWQKHVAVHHPTPNVIGLDDDADLLPTFTITERDVAEARGLRRWWFEHQWLAIPFAIAFNALNVQQAGVRYLVGCLRDSSRRTKAHVHDALALLGHVALWLVIPAFFFGPLAVLGLYAVRVVLLGYAIFIAFAPAHFPAEAAFVDREGKSRAEYFRKADYIFLQTSTTLNFRTGFLGRLFCAGVDYQIEHHLFPGYSHVYYPQMSRILRRFCEEQGYPYRTLGWWEAVWKSLVVFRKPKPILPRLMTVHGPVPAAEAPESVAIVGDMIEQVA
ncbi:fatty acid desaturase family protein [Hyalangium rubrum]|uniref:Fatty acid desaturase n=1 Tax=Hyalangium rubrum TaxID=3103134 RepID=A0ABU5H364_9BACT|nr:fatty acid desaturase [Hyalangium sp. s54d21]MDY7227233.1 fatty acid desaturase [Hyalangium sp. s54d21]